jgi:DedD protein
MCCGCLYFPPVERHLKERLIGAAVLVAAAVILIPEMLSGGRDESSGNARTVTPAGVTPLKTYTIDLSKSPGHSATPVTEPLTTLAPPPEAEAPAESDSESEQVAAAPAAQAIPESAAERSAPERIPEAPVSSQSAPAAVKPPAPASEPVTPARSASDVPEKASGTGWAVQLGSFSSRATADGMVSKLRSEDYDAFVMPVKSGANTLYRVRIGPMSDRQSAATTLSRIKAKVPAAAVVKHP